MKRLSIIVLSAAALASTPSLADRGRGGGGGDRGAAGDRHGDDGDRHGDNDRHDNDDRHADDNDRHDRDRHDDDRKAHDNDDHQRGRDAHANQNAPAVQPNNQGTPAAENAVAPGTRKPGDRQNRRRHRKDDDAKTRHDNDAPDQAGDKSR